LKILFDISVSIIIKTLIPNYITAFQVVKKSVSTKELIIILAYGLYILLVNRLKIKQTIPYLSQTASDFISVAV